MTGVATRLGRSGLGLHLWRNLLLPAGLLLSLVQAVQAAPLWELGAGAAGLAFPAYRGSSRYAGYVLPLPYLVYRGEHLRVDRSGVRGLLFDSDRLELDISLNGGVPVRSDDVPARAGMPDLDPVFELGPSLELQLSKPTSAPRWQVRLPVRAVFSVGDGIEHVGWVAHPNIALSWPDAFAGWRLGFSAGPLFGDRGYHAYYYEVDAAYTTPQRPRYRASSGYSGAAIQFTASRRTGSLWIGTFIRYDDLNGASFEASPLVDSWQGATAGLAIAWVFAQSEKAAAAGSKAPAAASPY